ncbi:MAG: MFS transporter [Firmicutes bacterium]|nr:MFS transporter [Bacillota bacterium]
MKGHGDPTMAVKNKSAFAWAMYDWADSAFACTIMAAVLPIFYRDVAAAGQPQASSFWAYTQSLSMLLVALISPVLGAIADQSFARVKFMRFFACLGITGTALLFLVDRGEYILCSLFYITGSIGFYCANVFYDSLLSRVAPPEEMDRLSARGYAMGYLGGGLLLALNMAAIMFPRVFFIPDTLWATKITFLSVALWWYAFSIPFFRHVREEGETVKIDFQIVRLGFGRLRATLGEIGKYRELSKFLLAFWLYNDGISTIILMATVYGRDVGIGTSHLIGALLLTQFVAFPFSLVFGRLAADRGAKRAIFTGIGIYTVIVALAYFMKTPLHFWVLAALVGTVQGGTQAISRSLYASMVPAAKSSEFFGFMGITGKFAAVFGPFLFGITSQLSGSSRNGIMSLFLFFLVGGLILASVNVEKGRQLALEQE